MDCIGDTWDPVWASDGKLYFPGNDGSGWMKACANNLFFNRAEGDDPKNLMLETISGMTEYGGWGERGADGCTWKSSGCLALDGELYMVIGRHSYGTESGDPFRRQTAQRASLIHSGDGGRTWERSASENYSNPMFPSQRFATPYFIHYGQDGHFPAKDGSEQFVYAISNNGFWCNGDDYILGRVERDKIARLDPTDWQFFLGGDGAQSANWSQNLEDALPIIQNPLKCGETGATYIPALDRYLLVAWYYPGDPNIDSDETHLIFYESPAPWGPWTLITEEISRPEGWYCPRVASKWQREIDNQSEIEAVLIAGGDYYEQSKHYNFTVVPLRIKSAGKFSHPDSGREPLIIDHGEIGQGTNRYFYQGDWQVSGDRKKALHGTEHLSDQTGAFFQLTFQGSRLRWYTSKENNMGLAEVSIDDGPGESVDLYTFCVVPLFGRFVFDSGPLGPGVHTFNVRVSGEKNDKSKGAFVSNDRIEIDTDA